MVVCTTYSKQCSCRWQVRCHSSGLQPLVSMGDVHAFLSRSCPTSSFDDAHSDGHELHGFASLLAVPLAKDAMAMESLYLDSRRRRDSNELLDFVLRYGPGYMCSDWHVHEPLQHAIAVLISGSSFRSARANWRLFLDLHAVYALFHPEDSVNPSSTHDAHALS